MVFFYTCSDERYAIYMGRDKFENEDLIKYGWPEDVWFHVKDMSSAHVYLRLPLGQTMADIPASIMEECCQLVKNNSIAGCKLASCEVVYTPWANLKKKPTYEVGQVSFHNDKQAPTRRVDKNRDIVNRIEKTKVERVCDLPRERAERDRRERNEQKRVAAERKRAEEEERERIEAERRQRSYDGVFEEEKMKTNKDMTLEEAEDDFM